jgi:hypothetical protein
LLAALLAWSQPLAAEPSLKPSRMPRIGTVDARFQSYNVEMVTVTGGRFWKPYPPRRWAAKGDLYQYRPPVDLANPTLRRLAAALGPAYVRVSGTWANATWFADSDPAPATPPAGFNSVLTRAQWRGVVEFAKAVDGRIVTSFAVSPGARDAGGVWMPDAARRLLAYTGSLDGSISAAEFMNEPSLAPANGASAGYDASAYGRDFGIFRDFLKQASPETLILGPGDIGEADPASAMRRPATAAIAANEVDGFSYHDYATLSRRCGGRDRPADALSNQWLSRTGRTLAAQRALAERVAPGKPLWLTETAGAACGGNAWEATFLDTFRYLDQLGQLARAGVQVVMHNTLSGSDYGLLDEQDFRPRPNYWAALVWRRLMGATVLDPGAPATAGLHVYAHCQRDVPGGVSLLVINTSRKAPRALTLPAASARYTLDASVLQSATMRLNGAPLGMGPNGALPAMAGIPTPAGAVTFAPATITFLAIPAAANPACR